MASDYCWPHIFLSRLSISFKFSPIQILLVRLTFISWSHAPLVVCYQRSFVILLRTIAMPRTMDVEILFQTKHDNHMDSSAHSTATTACSCSLLTENERVRKYKYAFGSTMFWNLSRDTDEQDRDDKKKNLCRLFQCVFWFFVFALFDDSLP